MNISTKLGRAGLVAIRTIQWIGPPPPRMLFPFKYDNPRLSICASVSHRLPLLPIIGRTPLEHTWRRASSTQRIPTDADSHLEEYALGTPGTTLTTRPADKTNSKITCIYFDARGNSNSGAHKHYTKAEIAEQFELRHRDLRDIDLKSEAVCRILVRSSTVLLQFFHLCMIIQHDEALLINNEPQPQSNADDEKQVREQQKAIYNDFERRMSGDSGETADVPELPYELRAVEAALVAVLSNLHHDLIEARQNAEDSARTLRLESGAGSMGLDLIFDRTRRLAKIEQKARLVRDTIREVLDADEDLAGMYLSDRIAGRAHDISDHQEAEFMLEAVRHLHIVYQVALSPKAPLFQLQVMESNNKAVP